ncbi:MAG: hypothetical protein RKP73_16235 [Candidatus Contendobacter sp.]|nr:hypothetical protein [Candidatus Contendobacter sp.]
MRRSRKATAAHSKIDPTAPLIVGLLAIILTGCNTIGGFAGAAAGIASGAATTNPAVGYGVSVGVAVAVDVTAKYVFRTWHQAEQDQIAAQIGRMKLGDIEPWKIQHPVPYENEHGEVEVVRILASPLALCKEALFSVVDGEGNKQTRQWFVVTACRRDKRWKWAVAEPAVGRWGSLQ